MTAKTHQMIGLTAATAGFFALQPLTVLSWPLAVTVIAGSFFGSLAPDIDQPTSNFWNSIPVGGALKKVIPKTLGGHRNLSHSILGIALFSWLMWLFVFHVFRPGLFDFQVFLQSFMLGFGAHLLADTITVEGVPYLWPFGDHMGFPPRPLQGARIVTGKWFEHLVVLPLAFVGLIYILSLHIHQFCVLAPRFCR